MLILSGEVVVYEGMWIEDSRSGQRKYISASGAVYRGSTTFS